ncbi:uncharacterized protein LOC108095723 [Drosophila ficusphila]|uniref:uncharacterized protein LOC108095723 n=1 Tax=Drosophila ficusphila TaxID=30025 RepID=UPI0007E8A672|nr:uncharacterized protein LOC108095723 [Drosophila ficusphila]
MRFTLFAFVVIFALGFLGQHQSNADCNAATSNHWKNDDDLDEGSCPSKETDENEFKDTDEAESDIRNILNDEPETEVQQPVYVTIIKFIKFVWEFVKAWWSWQ